jgi:hypothetical protein
MYFHENYTSILQIWQAYDELIKDKVVPNIKIMIMPDYNVTLAVVPIAETCDKGIKCYTSEISPFL